jgi:PAS domain S-box-containing protein
MSASEAVSVSTQPVRGTSPSNSPEMRLKRILESAPASIIVASPEGSVLAANHDALRLLGVGQLDDVLGANVSQWVASEHRERFRAFVSQVCAGEGATLEYDIAALDGMMRSVETRAVPLSREGIAPAAFLSVTWDVTERKRGAVSGVRQSQAKSQLLEVQLAAQRETYERALREAKTAHEQTAGDLAKARATSDEAVRDARAQLAAKTAEAEARHAELTAQWETEREALNTRLRDAEERHASSIEAIAQHDARQLATLESLETQHQQALAEKTAENERLEAALNVLRTQLAQVDEERHERRRLEAALEEERTRYVKLTGEQEQWRAKLADLLQSMGQVTPQDPQDPPAPHGVVVPFSAVKSDISASKPRSDETEEAAWGNF